eukprot:15465950-Alexandrium_andersonii.AAC.2
MTATRGVPTLPPNCWRGSFGSLDSACPVTDNRGASSGIVRDGGGSGWRKTSDERGPRAPSEALDTQVRSCLGVAPKRSSPPTSTMKVSDEAQLPLWRLAHQQSRYRPALAVMWAVPPFQVTTSEASARRPRSG